MNKFSDYVQNKIKDELPKFTKYIPCTEYFDEFYEKYGSAPIYDTEIIPLSIPPNLTEKEMQFFKNIALEMAWEAQRMSIIYQMECCGDEIHIPINPPCIYEKIRNGKCKNCEKGDIAILKEPLEFWYPLLKEKITLEQMKEMDYRNIPFSSYIKEIVEGYRPKKLRKND